MKKKTTPELKGRFLELLADGHTVAGAAGTLGLRRQAFYEERARDEDFARAWEDGRPCTATTSASSTRATTSSGV